MDIFKNTCITIKDLTKLYSSKVGLKKVSVNFEAGTLNLIVGKNGSGKSTLLKCIMGLTRYNGLIIKRRYKIGYAPEEYLMPESMIVVDFLRIIGRIKNLDLETFEEIYKDYLKLFNILNYHNKMIRSLSNGMKQKLNLLQALIHNPKIIILDEPLSALDKDTKKTFIKMITEKAKTALVIISTHHPESFRTKNRRVYRIDNGILDDEWVS